MAKKRRPVHERFQDAQEKGHFSGTIAQVRIITNTWCYGMTPGPNDVVEQDITLYASGKVKAKGYGLGRKGDVKHKLWKEKWDLDDEIMADVFHAISTCFATDPVDIETEDVGVWAMEVTDTEGITYAFYGTSNVQLFYEGYNLSHYMRGLLENENLFLFDGNGDSPITHIEVSYYHHATSTPDAINEEGLWELVTHERHERLVIDRATQTVTYTHRSQDKRMSRTFAVGESVDNLLDYIEDMKIWKHKDFPVLYEAQPFGEPQESLPIPKPHVPLTPLVEERYSIVIDTESTPSYRYKTGAFSKDVLPGDYDMFMQIIQRFMDAYGLGHIFDESLYSQAKRRVSDYIYCGCSFEEGGRLYHYRTDDPTIEKGDFVLVPVGSDNVEKVVLVETVDYYSAEEAPYPVAKTKKIIRKCNELRWIL